MLRPSLTSFVRGSAWRGH